MKRFKTNNYSDAILEAWDDFKVFNLKDSSYEGNPRLFFSWSFKNYEGTGYIDCDDSFRVRNTGGDNYSYLSLSSSCREKNIGLKPTDSLYNDSGLEVVFQRIIELFLMSEKAY